jgi:1-acyl-sn-glycerol-3-phosphate acyltransferase
VGFWEWVRVIWRSSLLILWTTALFALRMCAKLLTPLSTRADEWCRRKLLRIWAAGTAAIIRMHVTVEGRPPKPPYFLVTNHLTYLDIVLLSHSAGCVFVSRADVQGLKIIGFMAKALNTIFITRENIRDTYRVNEQISETMDKGYGVHMFAESRISQDAKVHPFKPPLLEPAVRKGVPVYYAALSYSTPEGCPRARDVVVWKEPQTLGQNMLQVLRLPRLSATIRFGDAPISGTDRKELAARLYEAVRDRFTPVG